MKALTTLLLLFSLLLVLPSESLAQDSETDLKYRRWRITLLPPISTNGVDAPNYTAKYSINLLGGYHGGLDGMEVGGLFNYNKYYANGFQIAGGANISGGDIAGVNFAGITNISKYDMTGIQVSGIANIAGDDLV